MTNCLDNFEEHHFGLWNETNTETQAYASRTCLKCGFKRVLPLTKEISQEIRKQKEANIYFKAFTMVKNDDSKILGYLNIILDDCLNYLSQDNLSILKDKIDTLTIPEQLGKIDSENLSYLKAFSTYLFCHDFEKLDDVLTQFQTFNEKNFSTILDIPMLDEFYASERKPR